MVIFKGLLFGVALFMIGSLVYMLAANTARTRRHFD